MRPLRVFKPSNQFLDQARQGIVLDVLLIHPLISGRKNGFAFRLSEEKVGKAFEGMRDKVFISSKTQATTKEKFEQDLYTTLTNL